MKILKHLLVCFSFILFVVCAGLGYPMVGIFVFLFAYAVVFGKQEKVSIKGGMNEVDQMDGIAFEHFTAKLLEQQGYRCKVTQAAGDFGADIIAVKGRDKVAVQCKRYSQAVGIDAVYQTLGGMKYYNCSKGMVVTNNNYTEAAGILAGKAGVMLISRKELEKMVKNSKH